jgi:hypothetical protein
MPDFDLPTASAIFDWLYLTLPLHEEAVARAEIGLASPAALDVAIVRALVALDAEPTTELFAYLRWRLQRQRADEAAEAEWALDARERRPVRIDGDGIVRPLAVRDALGRPRGASAIRRGPA